MIFALIVRHGQKYFLRSRPLVRLKLLQNGKLLLLSLLLFALLLLKLELQRLNRIRTVNFLSVNVVAFNERVDLIVLLLDEHLIDLSVQEVEHRRVLALDGALQFQFCLEVLQV